MLLNTNSELQNFLWKSYLKKHLKSIKTQMKKDPREMFWNICRETNSLEASLTEASISRDWDSFQWLFWQVYDSFCGKLSFLIIVQHEIVNIWQDNPFWNWYYLLLHMLWVSCKPEQRLKLAGRVGKLMDI